MTESTYVFRHADEKEARRFSKELVEHYSFMGDGDTHIIAMGSGDQMAVLDAVRAALLCDALDGTTERSEFALDMCECVNWDDCMKLAKKWELEYFEGQFIDLRKQSTEAPATAQQAAGD